MASIEKGIRNLDVTTTSMSKIALNNLIVKMRHLVKRCRIRVISKLVRQIKKHRTRTGTQQKIDKFKRKADRLVEDIQIIKKLDKDKTAQHCLSNTATVKEAENWPAEQKAMTRIACDKVMQDFVLKWRQEHDDWKSLAAFLSERVTRRLKKRTNKLESEAEEKTSTEPDQQDAKGVSQPVKSKQSPKKAVPEESALDVQNDTSEENKELTTPEKASPVVKKSPTKDKKKQTTTESDSVQKVTEDKPLVVKKPKNKHMVVKRLQLSELSKETADIVTESDTGSESDAEDVAFLFDKSAAEKSEGSEDKPVAPKKKDAFFVTGDDDEDEEEDDESGKSAYSASEDDDSDAGGFGRKRPKLGENMSESTFMGTLSRHQEKSMRTNPAFQRHNQKPFHGQHSRPEKPFQHQTKNQGRFQDRGPPKHFATKDYAKQSGGSNKPHSSPQAKLHPSWEASKKRKMECQISTFQGTRKTFDD